MKVSLGRPAALAAASALLLMLGAAGAAAQPASGNPPPPKGLEVNSASFVTAQTGFALGARGCSRLPCRALLEETTTGGNTWTSLRLPKIMLVPAFSTSPASAVSTVRFENASDGWVFGPALWATTDGGKHWHRQSLPGRVIALAASDGVAFASAEPTNGGINQARLYESKVGTGTWTKVRGVVPQNALTVSGHSVWAGVASGVGPGMWTSTDSGGHWSKLPFRCPHSAISASPVAAASPSDVAIGCSDESYPQPGFSVKKVYTSSNGGRTFHKTATQPAEVGQVGMLAMPPGNPRIITMTAASGASFLYRSADGGATWQQQTWSDGGLELSDLALVSADTGYLVHFSGANPVIAYSLGLLKTTNAGKTWKTVAIP